MRDRQLQLRGVRANWAPCLYYDDHGKYLILTYPQIHTASEHRTASLSNDLDFLLLHLPVNKLNTN